MEQRWRNGGNDTDRMQILFQAAFVLYTSATCLQTTMYTRYAVLFRIFSYMRYLAFALLTVLILFDIRKDLRKAKSLRGRAGFSYCKYSLLFVLAGTAASVVSFKTGDRTPLFAAAFLFAGKRKYLENTFRNAFAVLGGCIALTVFGSMTGVIPDLLIKREDIPIRHSLGFTYPSVCTAYFFFLLLLYLWIYEDTVCQKDLLWIQAVNVLLYILTDTRIVFLLGSAVLLAAFFFCCKGAGKRWTRRVRKAGRTGGLLYKMGTGLYDYFVVILFFIYALWCRRDQLSGGNSILDRVLSGRLGLTVSAVKKYGIHLFAEKIAWVGFGGTEDTDALLGAYNFVDCSYAYILLSYGVVLFLLVMIYLVFLKKYIRKRESVWRCLLMLVILSYCLLEPRLLEIQANCFLLLGAPVLRVRRKGKGMEYHG